MMPRIRTVKPELFKHEGLFDAERASGLPLRLGFIALLGSCDREGRFYWRPRRLKVDMLPYDDDIDLEKILNALASYGFIKKYQHQGKWYGCIPSWSRHQHINQREAESEIPALLEILIPNPMKERLDKEELSPEAMFDEIDPLLPRTVIEDLSNTEEKEEDTSYRATDLPIELSKIENSIFAKELQLSNTQNLLEKFNTDNEISLNPPPDMRESSPPLSARTCMHVWKGKGREMEEERKGKGKGDNTIVASKPRRTMEDSITEEIFEYWKGKMNHPHAKLDPKRKALIGKALGFGYDIEQLCQAISGCSITPHNMGDNERGQRYDGLHVILRDSDQIDRFIHNYYYPPRSKTTAERKTQGNVQALQQWVQQKMQEENIHASA
jgi:hypothetical protein